jgi:hypothetical protein
MTSLVALQVACDTCVRTRKTISENGLAGEQGQREERLLPKIRWLFDKRLRRHRHWLALQVVPQTMQSSRTMHFGFRLFHRRSVFRHFQIPEDENLIKSSVTFFKNVGFVTKSEMIIIKTEML